MDVDYDPNQIDEPSKLRERFSSFGGLSLQTDDDERFFVAFKLQAKRWDDEESLFNELCSHALNANQVVDMNLLEKIDVEFKPKPKLETSTRLAFPRAPTSANSTRGVLNELENVTPRSTRFVPLKPNRHPDSPISTEPTNQCGAHFMPIDLQSSNSIPELRICEPKATDDLFFYGKQFSDEDVEEISIEDQVTSQLVAAEEEVETRLEVHGRLLLQRTEGGDELVLLKSGSSTLQLDISTLTDFSYFHGMLKTFECTLTTPTCLKANSVVQSDPMSLASLKRTHDSLRVIVVQGLMNGTTSEEENDKRVDWVVQKVLSSAAHTLVLSGPFCDPTDSTKFTTKSARTFQLLCAKLKGQPVCVLVVPNAIQDPTAISVFPTPPMTPADFGVKDQPTNFHFLTDPCVFDVNGVRFGVTCSQSIWMLAASEKFQGTSQGDRMTRLCGHILDQRSLCPTFLHSRVPVLREDFRPHLTERPHFVLVPSNLVSFVKVNQNVVFVNPQFCGKNTIRFATIDVNLRMARESKKAANELNIFDFSQINLQKEVV